MASLISARCKREKERRTTRMPRAAKKRALLANEEPNLYDEEEAVEDESEELTGDAETHTNGATPEEVAYLETEDEDELRELISKIDDVVEELLDVPEWKVNGKVVEVLLRTLTTFERTSFINAMMRSNNDINKVYPDLVILSARHPKTKKL